MSDISSLGAFTAKPSRPPEPAAAVAKPNQDQGFGNQGTAAAVPPKSDKVEPVNEDTELTTVGEVLTELAKTMPEGSRLSIRRDGDAKRFIYEFRDPVSNEVIRRFPAESITDLASAIGRGQGVMVNDRV
jgi:uncharacterized FlaG/YvyC family protein